MKDQAATALQPLREIAPLKPFTDDFFRRSKEISDSIAHRVHPIHLDIAESDEAVTVRAEVPGFSGKDLDIRLEPRCLAITGERETKEERKTEKKLYSERCVDQVFRAIDLPAEVNPEKATATLKDGILQLAMPKAAAARNIKAEAKAV